MAESDVSGQKDILRRESWCKIIMEAQAVQDEAFETWAMTPRSSRLIKSPFEAQELACTSYLLAAAGLPTMPAATADNPYLKVYDYIMQRLPPEALALHTDETSLSTEKRAQLASLAQTDAMPLLIYRGDLGAYVHRATYDAFHLLIHGPLTNLFSFAVPNAEAIATMVKYSPLVELGAGTAYWAELARSAGASITTYDIDTEGRPRGESFGQVIDQSHLDLTKLDPTTALMLCWPVRPGGLAWDADVLAKFPGSTVLHIGEWAKRTLLTEPHHGQTTSLRFQQAIEQDFRLVERIPIPSWPWCADELTVWQRSST
ncbi:hypothetical protein CYMTET_23891 [Cymbomonas tetramitiformis]|uniref:Uncharacterized protein n=1 Tax=Cymbomonas tetramitiformis TaxID=36881 RepID=A0AAE0FXA7_9CHLO|nr:hypothetical protein CYMTET_23891 [Cymbomonas tetramitiformis]